MGDYEVMKWNIGGRCSADSRVRGHRHDQTVAGVLAYELGLKLLNEGLQPWRRARRTIRPDAVIIKGGHPVHRDGPSLLLGRVAGRLAALQSGRA